MANSVKTGPALSLGDISQALVVFSLLLYTFGFITVNAYLANFGVQRFDLLEIRYITAGALVFVILFVFGLFVGRRVLYGPLDTGQIGLLGQELPQPLKFLWELFSLISNLTELAFGVAIGASWIGALLFEGTNIIPIAIILSTFFLVDYALLLGKVYAYRPKLALMIAFLLHLVSLIAFYKYVQDPPIWSLFWAFAFGAIAVDLVLDLRKRRSQSDYKWVVILGFLTGSVGFSVYFGSNLYGESRRGLGGGKPPLVRVFLKEDTPAGIKKLLSAESDVSDELLLLSETPQEIVVLPRGKENPTALLLNKGLVSGISFSR